jgi:ADP-ribose pyrophosphatase YjhB (NUDIX family)
MPGGALEVGETPAEGVARETLEEAGVRVRATRLVGLFDSRFSGRATAHHIYMFLFLCEPLFDDAQPATATSTDEVVEVQWFLEKNLPTEISAGHDIQIPVGFQAWHTPQPAFFDGMAG